MPGKNFLVMGSPGAVIIERAGEFQNAGTSVLPFFDRIIHQLRYTIDYLSLQWKTPCTKLVICITNAAGQIKKICGQQKFGVHRLTKWIRFLGVEPGDECGNHCRALFTFTYNR